MSNTIADNLQRLTQAKSDIADAITAKGGTVNQGDGFEEFPADIASIPSGSGSEITINNISCKCDLLNKTAKKTLNSIKPMVWHGLTSGNLFIGNAYGGSNYNRVLSQVWSDGVNYFYSYKNEQYVFDSATRSWNRWMWFTEDSSPITIYGDQIWTDGTNIFYSNRYILDKSTSTWKHKTWNGLTNFNRHSIWTDGTNLYYSNGSVQKVLDKSTSTWNDKTWNGIATSRLSAQYIWTDGTYIYLNYSDDKYYLDVSTDTWQTITWSGSTPNASGIWSDGENTYYTYYQSSTYYHYKITGFARCTQVYFFIDTDSGLTSINFSATQVWCDGNTAYISTKNSSNNTTTNYVLNKTTTRLETITMTCTYLNASSVWTDGIDIFYSEYLGSRSYQKVLDKSTSTWNNKSWSGLNRFDARYIWTDGSEIYYSNGSTQKVLDKSTSTWNNKSWSGLTDFNGFDVWTDGIDIFYSSLTNSGKTQCILNKSTSTWTAISFGTGNFSGSEIFMYNSDVYLYGCYSGSNQGGQPANFFILDKNTHRDWELVDHRLMFLMLDGCIPTIEEGYGSVSARFSHPTFTDGNTIYRDSVGVWSDGDHRYYSSGDYQYILSNE